MKNNESEITELIEVGILALIMLLLAMFAPGCGRVVDSVRPVEYRVQAVDLLVLNERGDAISNADVTYAGLSVKTNADGVATFSRCTNSPSDILLNADGYEPYVYRVTFAGGGSSELMTITHKLIIVLSAVAA